MHLLLLFQVLWMTWRPQEFHVLVLQPKQLSWRPVRAFPRPSWNVTASPQLATGPSPTPSRPVTTSARQYYRRICEAIHFIKVTVLVLDCWKLVLVQLNWRSSWDWRWGFLFTVKDCLWLRSFVFRAVKRIKSDTVKEDGSFLPQMVSWVNDLRCNDRLSDERSRTEQSGINRFVTFIDKGEGKRGKKMSCAQWEPFLWSCKASWAEQQLPYSDSLHPYGSQTHSPTAARTANVKWCTKKTFYAQYQHLFSVCLWRQRGGREKIPVAHYPGLFHLFDSPGPTFQLWWWRQAVWLQGREWSWREIRTRPVRPWWTLWRCEAIKQYCSSSLIPGLML